MAAPRQRRVVALALVLAACACAGSPPAFAARPHRHGYGHSYRHSRASHRGCSHTWLRPNRKNLKLIRGAILCLVNRERAVHGERALRMNMRLQWAAQAHTESMAFGDYFEHFGPHGQTPLARIRAAGYISRAHASFEVGENIAFGTLTLATPRAIVAAWMHSPGHRANILNRHYRETGIGVSAHPPTSLAHGQPGAIYTQDFGVITGG